MGQNNQQFSSLNNNNTNHQNSHNTHSNPFTERISEIKNRLNDFNDESLDNILKAQQHPYDGTRIRGYENSNNNQDHHHFLVPNHDDKVSTQNSSELVVHHLIFDTDIASDIDDSLALLSLLHLPRECVRIVGVTTVYGHVEIRSAVSRKIIQAHEQDLNFKLDIPVVTGSNYPMNEPVVLPCWHSETEGIGLFSDDEIQELKNQRNCFLDRHELEKVYSKQAAEFIVEKAQELNGNLTIVSLGGLTNVAMALKLNPHLPELVNKLVYMGGGVVPVDHDLPQIFERGKEYHCHSCHNIRQDQYAAAMVFSAGFNFFCVGHTVTHSIWFEGPIVDEMRSLSFHRGSNPYANDQIIEEYQPNYLRASHVVGTLLDVWLKHRTCVFHTPIKGTCPHDALTTYEAIFTERFLNYVRGHFVVNEQDGRTCFLYDPNGNAHIAISWKDGMVDHMMDLLQETMFKSLNSMDDLKKFGL
ncbi:hypothetical protein C9374_012385 [Naegleria lovaniensis]|uniref:Inosine/uridine-preferring nucleoside hydrolase domain-containing protein n=1 Tax=Naegleria lovaniensis TaxID=51637 RepID=A0AA88GW49_NAELO|nr:uncharacterized protein C9374_012385 [Naegleria lovaniensis]KAG2392133.1 hypothetical protein C9374_012385 [Naegleria lovaniensis]